MPVAPSKGHASRALIVSTVAIVLVVGGLWLASVALSSRNSTELRIGDQTFQGAQAAKLAPAIAEDGPIIFSDVSGEKDRDIILQHLGSKVNSGWYAFLATPPGVQRGVCVWTWDPDAELFREEPAMLHPDAAQNAACDATHTAPADGKGLERYPVKVVDGRLDIDLNAADRTTTTTRPTTTSVIESGNGATGN